MKLVTIDFHNTLFSCDTWFRLEVEDLPDAVLDSFVDHEQTGVHQRRIEARETYREIRRVAMDSGVECDAEESIWRVAQRLDLPFSREQLDNSIRAVMLDALNDAHPMSGATELVNDLYADGFKLGVVSSAAYHPFLEWCLDRFQLRDAFSHVVTSADCGVYKSDPAIYRHTLKLFGVEPDCAVHIGDSHRFDVASAAAVGMRTILVARQRDPALTPAPDAVIRTLGDARPELDRLLRTTETR